MKDKNRQRTIFGVGPKWALWSAAYSLPITLLVLMKYPVFVIDSPKMIPLQIVGTLMVISGFVFYIISVRTMIRAFHKTRLVTTGVFGVCRNPIYSSFIVMIFPGLAALFRMPLLLAIPLIMYVVLKFKIGHEERELLDIFGEEYRNYMANVNAVFPIKLLKTKQDIRPNSPYPG
jgi:protein-S-isoprenylcysteine O-methyltransferase Ste14